MRGVLRKLTVVLAAASVCLCAKAAPATDNYLERMDRLGDVVRLPEFDLRALDGSSVCSADLVGKKVVLMAFWSMYCRACVEKFGSLVKIRAKYDPSQVEIISVNTDGEYGLPDETVREFLRGLEAREAFRINFPVVYRGGDALAAKMGIVFLPAIVAAGKEGRIVGLYRRFSEDSEGEIIRGIESVIPEEGREPPP